MPVKKFKTIIKCFVILSVINYVETHITRSFFVSKQEWIPYPSYSGTSLVLFITLIFVLFFSFLLRNLVYKRSLLFSAFTCGIIAFCANFIYVIAVLFGGYNIYKTLAYALAQGVIGFLFPILYHKLSKVPLFNEHFY